MRLVAGASSADKYGGSFEREIAGVESGLRAHFAKRQNVPKSVDFIVQAWIHVKKQNEQIRSLKHNLSEMSVTAECSQLAERSDRAAEESYRHPAAAHRAGGHFGRGES